MIKPKRLNKGDKVAIVSLSWGGLGEPEHYHRLAIAHKRLTEEYGLEVEIMPHAVKKSKYIYEHPEKRAEDLMKAFRDPSIDAVICAIGGNDTIRLLPYIDFDVLRDNPKIFMGYSDTTINHLMMQKAGIVSFYGPSIMGEFGEYGEILAYTKNAIRRFLFEDSADLIIEPSEAWSNDFIPWTMDNMDRRRELQKEEHGYELLQGSGRCAGHLLGGCLETLIMANGTSIWPTLAQWNGALLFLETSEECPSPELVKYMLRNLAAQGILHVINGILFAKPHGERYYEEYKEFIVQVLNEEGLSELPVLYNMNFGHNAPMTILPLGIFAELDCKLKQVRLLESATIQSVTR